MSRIITDIQPVVVARFVGGEVAVTEQAARASVEGIADLLGKDFEVTVNLETHAQCVHCNGAWTESSQTYNGGCCDKDEAENPERLVELSALAESIDGEDFYRLDEDGKRGRVVIDWPEALASAATTWLATGRPADGVAALLPLINRVRGEEWCTVWEDPGPSGCSLARLPDRVDRDTRPDELAHGLADLIDDMGLTPAKPGAPA